MTASDLQPATPAEWCLRVKSGSLSSSEQAQLEAWLAASPERPDAFLRALDLWDGLGGAEAGLGLIDMRAEALSDLRRRKSKSVILSGAQELWRVVSAPRRLRAAAAFAAALIVGSGAFYGWQARATVYETGRGQTQIVQLADGSIVRLDADTRVRVAKGQRKLWIDRGRARLELSRAHRRFDVYAGARRISADAGAMSVEKVGDSVNVVVLRGAALVAYDPPGLLRLDAPQTHPAQIVRVNQELTASDQAATAQVRAADPNLDDVWQNGLLAFDDEPVALAIARVNRYAAQPVRLDHIGRRIKVSGIYRAGDTRAFVEGVCAVNGLSYRLDSQGYAIGDAKPEG
ncbi:MAG: FecR family protein [Asticcacaulis sp.]|uniref:FecR family protein n=1 Tax=Asticcacaulis sp. TaxID=1872648 RepID=UPI003F7B537C